MNSPKHEGLRQILCALQYLSSEAKQLELKPVSDIINSSITKINVAIENANTSFDDVMLHSDTLNIMQFLYAYASANEDTRINFIKALKDMKIFTSPVN